MYFHYNSRGLVISSMWDFLQEGFSQSKLTLFELSFKKYFFLSLVIMHRKLARLLLLRLLIATTVGMIRLSGFDEGQQ